MQSSRIVRLTGTRTPRFSKVIRSLEKISSLWSNSSHGLCFGMAGNRLVLLRGFLYTIIMRIETTPSHKGQSLRKREGVPADTRSALLPVAKRVFWWGRPEEWLDDATRFVAQVMTFGDWNDTALVWKLLGDSAFQRALQDPPPGVFDIKSWTYWHVRYHLEVPPLPNRRLTHV